MEWVSHRRMQGNAAHFATSGAYYKHLDQIRKFQSSNCGQSFNMGIFIKWHKKGKGVTKLNQFSSKEGLAILQASTTGDNMVRQPDCSTKKASWNLREYSNLPVTIFVFQLTLRTHQEQLSGNYEIWTDTLKKGKVSHITNHYSSKRTSTS